MSDHLPPSHHTGGMDHDGANTASHEHALTDTTDHGGDPFSPDAPHSDFRTPFEELTDHPDDPLNLLVAEILRGHHTGDSAAASPADPPPAATSGAVADTASAAAAANLVRVGQKAQAANSAADMDVPDADEEDEPVEEYLGVGTELFLPLEGMGAPDPVVREYRGLRIGDAAWDDLRNAAESVARKFGPASAAQFLAHLEAVLNAVRISPVALGTPRPAADFDHDPALTHLYVYYVSTGPYPCDVFYRCLPDPDGAGPERARAEILRVLHGSVEQPWLFPEGAAPDGG